MTLRKEFIDAEELLEEVSWLTQKFSQLTSWFGSQEAAALDPKRRLINMQWLENM